MRRRVVRLRAVRRVAVLAVDFFAALRRRRLAGAFFAVVFFVALRRRFLAGAFFLATLRRFFAGAFFAAFRLVVRFLVAFFAVFRFAVDLRFAGAFLLAALRLAGAFFLAAFLFVAFFAGGTVTTFRKSSHSGKFELRITRNARECILAPYSVTNR